MTTIQLLKDTVDAINQIPNVHIKGKYKDTYALAKAIGEHIDDMKEDGDETRYVAGLEEEKAYEDSRTI